MTTASQSLLSHQPGQQNTSATPFGNFVQQFTGSPQASQGASQRCQLMEDRLHQPLGPSTPASELSNLHTNAGKSGTFTICCECRRSDATKAVDKRLGMSCVPYSEATTLLEVKENMLKEVNPHWSANHPSDLRSDEAELCVLQNIALPSDTALLTLWQFYDRFNQPALQQMYIQVPKIANKSVLSVAFKLFIDVEKYNKRIGDDGVLSKPTGRKWKGNSQTFVDTQVSKQLRNHTSRVLSSSFARDTGVPQVIPVTTSDKIIFHHVICTIEEELGNYNLMEQATDEHGLIARQVMQLPSSERGKTKDIYLLIIDGKEYVAKKLVNIGQGCGEVISTSEACQYLVLDLIRLKRLDYFSLRFRDYAMQKGADIAVYLVEPHHMSTAVQKFSGTLGVSNRPDKLSAMIMAFSHFVIQETACEYMFSDLQGSMDHRRNTPQGDGNTTGAILTLFDPMTHTPLGGSGLGDHGIKGFQDFAESHQCSHICCELHLCTMDEIKATIEQLEHQVDESDPELGV
ncbi:hypothetical protein SCLCIDRAFT_27100 [Scleroderma citrinum Foug A]|uniref:Alpha-type protein kinase domain-containing protein n=1 Tax=Scleroderma citrinum Foug A TaxID=1036808 RepID=A0A0C3DUT1_9AGAM|nr:hypothetical protein SCLCIDRAFT_27100 [Scleroderma citrinum Foug A]